jgi:hypothetical protein
MESSTHPAYNFTLLSAGPDWLTSTAGRDSEGKPFREAAERLLDEERAAGGDVKPAALRDYNGRRGKGFYVGERKADRIIILSGDRCATSFASVAPYARNVSRLDLQATVWTHGEQPHLGLEGLRALDQAPPKRGRKSSYGIYLRRPRGETLEINSRISDAYGRLYDWASAHKAGEARTVWRYEIEFKRHLAARQARAALDSPCLRTMAGNTVHTWYKVKGLEPTWDNEGDSLSEMPAVVSPDRDTLAWLETSMRITIRKAVDRYGLDVILSALGLSDMVTIRKEAKGKHGRHSDRSLPRSNHR